MAKLKDQDWIVFCDHGYTRQTSTDGRTWYLGQHRDTGRTCSGRTREACEKNLAKITDNELRVQEAIAFLRENGYSVGRPV